MRRTHLPIFLVLSVLLLLLMTQSLAGILGFEKTAETERVNAVETAIQKAAVQCYAIEGSYPPDIQYMVDHYGLVINPKAYFYHYEIEASNLMPVIAVYKKWTW